MTLVLLILYGAQGWSLDVPLRVFCGVMLVATSLTTSRILWLLICAAVAWVNASNWFSIDNHKYLITYWCFAIAIAVASGDPDRILAWNARLLIGLCFAFAVFWKFAAGQFINGAFLHFTFLHDTRVEATTIGIGGLGADALADNRKLLSLLRTFPADGTAVTLSTSATLRGVTLAMSYWTLLIEGSVALSFCSPRPRFLSNLRDLLLMGFIGTTYFLLPVTGFALVLAIMGFAQCDPARKRTRICYLVLCVLIQLTRVPWDDYAVQWLT
jgi:hypothetical protein